MKFGEKQGLEVGCGQAFSPNFIDNDFDNRLNYLILNNCFNGFYFKWASAADCQQAEALILLQDGKVCD